MPRFKKGVGEPAGSYGVAAERKPDRAQPQVTVSVTSRPIARAS